MPTPQRILDDLRAMPPDQVVEPGVTAGDALAVMTFDGVPEGVRYVPDQVYGRAGRDLTMRLFARKDPHEQRPGIVFVHGGGFIEGFPEMMIRYAADLAAEGWVTAAIEYRLAHEAPFPAALEDSKCAIRWMREHAAELGLDRERIAVAGGSAGGLLAAMVGSTPGRFEGDGGCGQASSAVSAVLAWYPVLDLRPHSMSDAVRTAIGNAFGREPTRAELHDASPLTYAASAPPTLTLVGTEDPAIPLEGVRDYHETLDAAGIPNRVVEFPGVGHSFDFNLARWRECLDAARAWLREHVDG